MVLRRRRLIVQLALVGVLTVLLFPAAGSALDASFIALTADGPAPAALTIPAGMYPVWKNQDTVPHTVTFASGCSIEVAPGGSGQCTNGLGTVVGDYAYTVDGKTQASVTVTPESRAVLITMKRHSFRLGSKFRLHGRLAVASVSPPAPFGPRMPVTVFLRPHGGHVWHRVAAVIAKPLKQAHVRAYSVWSLWVRPRSGTTYRVEATSQPTAGPYWQDARSKPFRVTVRR